MVLPIDQGFSLARHDTAFAPGASTRPGDIAMTPRHASRITGFAVAAAVGCSLTAFTAVAPPAGGTGVGQARASAQGASQSATPGAHVDVTATPKVVLAGQPVTISGSTGYSQKQHQAAVLIRHESGTPSTTSSAAVSPKGQFSVAFAETKKAGKYKVSVTSPDGKGRGDTEFRVDSIAGLAQEVEKLSTELDKRTKALVGFVKKTAVSLPASAERDQLITETQQLEAKANVIDLPPVKILGQLKNLDAKPNVVNLPDQTIFGALRDWVPEAEEAIDKIDRARIGEKPAPICETINTAIEGAKFAQYAFVIEVKLLETLITIGLDKGIPLLVKSLGFEEASVFGLSSAIKVSAGALHGPLAAAKACAGVMLEAVEHFTKWMFERYCGSFDGPLGVSMTMEWKEGIHPWLKYSVRLEGRLRLRFPKSSPPGQPVYMTGELEGNATHFTFWEDVTVAEPVPKGIMVLERLWLPPVAFANSTASPIDFGMVARMVTPAYFNVPVIGEMTGDTIKMQFKEARVDFQDIVKNRLLFVVLTPLMPDYKVFSFPIQKAQWILSKGFSDPCIFNITESAGVKGIRMRKTPAHRETPNKSVTVDWVIDVDARKTGEGQEK